MFTLLFPLISEIKLVFASGLGPSSTAALMKPAEFRTSTVSLTQHHITQNAFHPFRIDIRGRSVSALAVEPSLNRRAAHRERSHVVAQRYTICPDVMSVSNVSL